MRHPARSATWRRCGGIRPPSTVVAGRQYLRWKHWTCLPPSAAVHHVIGQQFGAGLRRVHDPLADKIAQRLRGAAPERSVARSAIEARYRELIRETESAMQLDRLTGDAAGHLVTRDLGHRR